MVFLSALMFQIFICSRKHQLDPIELVDFAGSRIKVDCYDIGSRISSSELFDDTFPTTWFGRQANGCVQTIFAAPPWISSSISPVKNHPSPVWFPMETISDAISASFRSWQVLQNACFLQMLCLQVHGTIQEHEYQDFRVQPWIFHAKVGYLEILVVEAVE